MTKDRTIYDIEEEKIIFINEFLIDQCLQIEPNLDVSKLAADKKLTALQLQGEQYQYFFNEKIPLLFIDLKLLIDGV
jgi:hypothetical protein